MRRQAVRVLRLTVGGLLLLLGVVGLFVPILQGWLFIFAGLSVMAPESPTARRALDAVKRRFRRQRGKDESKDQATRRLESTGEPSVLRRDACTEPEIGSKGGQG